VYTGLNYASVNNYRMQLIAAGAAYSFLKIKTPIIRPMTADIFNLMYKLTISRLKPIGPVRFSFIIEKEGRILEINVPTAEPNIAPIRAKLIKYPIFALSNVIK